jgi:hypothetical protein
MQFTVSANLQQRIAKYDPALRSRLKAEAAAQRSATRGPAYPLGLPVGLIPPEIVPADAFLRALQTINNSPAIRQHEHWLDDDANFKAAVWHVNAGDGRKLWVAAYADPTEGLHLAWAARPGAASLPHRLFLYEGAPGSNPFDDEAAEILECSRSTFKVRRWYFTEASVASDTRYLHVANIWTVGQDNGRAACSNSEFIQQTGDRVHRYAKSMLSKSWAEQGSCPFARVQDTWASILRITDAPAGWVPSHSDFLKGTLVDTPWFRNQIQGKLNDILAEYDAPVASPHQVRNQWIALRQQCGGLQPITEIWPDASLDHLQALWAFSEQINRRLSFDNITRANWRYGQSGFRHFGENPVIAWIREHLPLATFVHWMRRSAEEHDNCWLSDIHRFNHQLAEYITYGMTWSDEKQRWVGVRELPRPKRLRLADLNRQLEERLWKLKTPDAPLPQDLFPEPVRVTLSDDRVSFFQPNSVHQLAEWGTAVRNCVGNGAYADRIKKFQNFIVLGMVNGKPTFTIQLSHRDGQLLTDQVVSTSNQSLSADQRLLYQQGMQQALQQQSEALAQ